MHKKGCAIPIMEVATSPLMIDIEIVIFDVVLCFLSVYIYVYIYMPSKAYDLKFALSIVRLLFC